MNIYVSEAAGASQWSADMWESGKLRQ